jgi:hypothetical protein
MCIFGAGVLARHGYGVGREVIGIDGRLLDISCDIDSILN